MRNNDPVTLPAPAHTYTAFLTSDTHHVTTYILVTLPPYHLHTHHITPHYTSAISHHYFTPSTHLNMQTTSQTFPSDPHSVTSHKYPHTQIHPHHVTHTTPTSTLTTLPTPHPPAPSPRYPHHVTHTTPTSTLTIITSATPHHLHHISHITSLFNLITSPRYTASPHAIGPPKAS